MQTWKITLDSPTDADREQDIQTLHVMCANRTVHWDFDITNDEIVFLTGDATALETILPALSGKPDREILDAEVMTFSRSERDKLLCEQYLYSSTSPSVKQLADMFGISSPLVYDILRKNRIPLRTKRDERREAIESTLPRLPNGAVKDILLDYLDGLDYLQLAQKYRKSPSYITKVLALNNTTVVPEDVYDSLAGLWESSFYDLNYCADVLGLPISDTKRYLKALGYNVSESYIVEALRNECNLMRNTIAEQTAEILNLKAELRK